MLTAFEDGVHRKIRCFFLLLNILVETEIIMLICRTVLFQITWSSSFCSKNSVGHAMSMLLLL